MKFENIKSSFSYAGSSLIGVYPPYPVRWGNYHTIRIWEKPEGFPREYRVVNMWYENLKDAMEKFIAPDTSISMRVYSSGFAVITDSRIPEDYYYRPMHFLYAKFDVDEIRHAYEVEGDPDNEFERFSNPKIYYARRGCVYSNGSIRISVSKDPNDPTKLEAARILKEYEMENMKTP